MDEQQKLKATAELLEQELGSWERLEAAERELQEKLRARGIYFGKGLIPTYVYAFLTTATQIERWASHAERFVSFSEHLARSIIANVKAGELELHPEERELVCVDPGYERTCVLCRPDGLPTDDGGIKFVELNSDSPAMMMFLDIVSRCLLELPALSALRGFAVPNAADRLLDTLLECYREQGKTDTPTIAITDWVGQKTQFEHQRLAEHFEARGCPTVVCDPHEFTRTDGKLYVGDRKIDLVYRRALASEVIERRAELKPLLDAYRDGSICMVNPLHSYLVGAKEVMSRFTGADPAFMQSGELVPRTLLLDTAERRELVAASPTKWVLKRSLGHGGSGVVLPEPEHAEAWQAALASTQNEVWIAQEYLRVPRLAVPMVSGQSVVRDEKFYNWNPFVFSGRYAGGLVRVSESPLINITAGGGLLATLVV